MYMYLCYVLLYEGKCKWSYGPTCPVYFPFYNIHSIVYSLIRSLLDAGWLSAYAQARILPWLPGLLFGALSIGSGLLTFFLPETLNRPLPQTIEDIENWSKKKPSDKVGDQDAQQQQEMAPVHDHETVDRDNSI